MERVREQTGRTGTAEYGIEQQYLIELPHTKESCLAALDKINELGRDKLEMWTFGCQEGNHTGYALLEADDISEALEFVPEDERKKAKIHKVTRLTPEQIEAYHRH
jgi:hypothetical protein